MGKLFVVEGIDRSGKSTLVAALATRYSCEIVKFPDRATPIGQLIDKVLRKEIVIENPQAIHLLFTANRWEVQNKVHALLKTGNVIMDRYYYSGIAYSVAQGLEKEWCLKKEDMLIQPDKVIYLDLKASTSASRKGFGEELYEKTLFLEKVTQVFLDLQEPHWKIINAEQSIEAVYKEAVAYLE